MPYSAEISRKNPAYIIFLVDQSGSMEGAQGGNPGKSKAQSVADAINRILQVIVERCSKGDAVYNYFAISVIGYGQDAAPALGGALSGAPLAWIGDLDEKPARIETRERRFPDGAGGIIQLPVRFPIWFDPVAQGPTPMCTALNLASQLVSDWIERQPNSFPPIVMNLTDGESTDGDPTAAARRLMSQATTDGNVLLFNLHLSSVDGLAQLFPKSEAGLVDKYARMLFSMSSLLPGSMVEHAQRMELPVVSGSRGFVFNADIVSIVQFLQIGTTPTLTALPPGKADAAVDLAQ
jgi:hypothetical protein